MLTQLEHFPRDRDNLWRVVETGSKYTSTVWAMSGRQLLSFLWRPVLIVSSFLALFIVVTHFDATSSSSSYTEDRQILRCGSCICLIALFWCTEVLPLEVTSLLPVVLLPMLGILNTGDVAREYFTGANMLLLAAMGVAGAARNVGLHRR